MRYENIITLRFTSKPGVLISDSTRIYLTVSTHATISGNMKDIERGLNILHDCRSYLIVLYTPSH
jgi:hypothetical protein